MRPHEQRVVVELEELNRRLDKLESFILDSPGFNAPAPAEQNRLRRQAEHMRAYSRVLAERIEAFAS